MTNACSLRSRLTQPLFLLWTVAIASQLAVDWSVRYTEPSSEVRSWLGFLPVPLWIFVIAAFARAVWRSDELQRRIHMQALSIAFVLAAVLMLVFAALERADIYHVTLSGVGGLLMVLLMIGYIVSAWRYR
jgi:hypothetical protein